MSPHPAAHGDPVTCGNKACGQEIGKLYAVESDLFLLQVGSLLIKEGHSMFCVHCGQPVHWAINDQRLEKLIRMVLRDQEGDVK